MSFVGYYNLLILYKELLPDVGIHLFDNRTNVMNAALFKSIFWNPIADSRQSNERIIIIFITALLPKLF